LGALPEMGPVWVLQQTWGGPREGENQLCFVGEKSRGRPWKGRMRGWLPSAGADCEAGRKAGRCKKKGGGVGGKAPCQPGTGGTGSGPLSGEEGRGRNPEEGMSGLPVGVGRMGTEEQEQVQ